MMTKKLLWIILGILTVLAIGLALSIILVNNNSANQTNNLIAEMNARAAFEEETSGAARALALNEIINNKLDNDPNYNDEVAIADFEAVYTDNSSSEELKFWIALYEANFIREKLGDLDRAIRILEEVAVPDGMIEKNNYYGTLAEFYRQNGNTEQANYYEGLTYQGEDGENVEN